MPIVSCILIFLTLIYNQVIFLILMFSWYVILSFFSLQSISIFIFTLLFMEEEYKWFLIFPVYNDSSWFQAEVFNSFTFKLSNNIVTFLCFYFVIFFPIVSHSVSSFQFNFSIGFYIIFFKLKYVPLTCQNLIGIIILPLYENVNTSETYSSITCCCFYLLVLF